jgi:hypothetical protein
MATMIFYPDAHPETSSVDGFVAHISGEQISWSALRDGAGTDAESDGTNTDPVCLSWVGIDAGSETDKWSNLYRGIVSFNKSAVPGQIVSATLSLYGAGKYDTAGWLPTINIYKATPVSATNLVAGDYTKLQTIPLCNYPISYSQWISGWNNFILNQAGIDYVSQSGVVKFGVRIANYDTANIAPAWSYTPPSTEYCKFRWWQAEKGGLYKPKLTVSYRDTTDPTAPGTNNIIGLEAIRNIEMSAAGRFYIDNEGNAIYEGRYYRSTQ